jgi:hypothetical protein
MKQPILKLEQTDRLLHLNKFGLSSGPKLVGHGVHTVQAVIGVGQVIEGHYRARFQSQLTFEVTQVGRQTKAYAAFRKDHDPTIQPK